MKLKTILMLLSLGVVVMSCKPKDADVQKAITEKIASTPEMAGMTVTVSEGVATLSGECKDDACKINCESIVKGMKGVKSVVNNCTVPAPVVINPDQELIDASNAVLAGFEGVESTVADGVINVTGTIDMAKWKELMPLLQELKPKKVTSEGLTINK